MPRSPQDIIVVGAGIIGCAIGYELARRGMSVRILDERATGLGATQASAGILAPHIEADRAGALLDLTLRSLDLFDDLIARVTADAEMTVMYRRTGTLQVAFKDDAVALADTARQLQAHGVEATFLDAAAVRSEEPHLSDDVAGGLVVPAHGFVAAGELTRALAAAARRSGARIDEGSAVRKIVALDRELAVETNRGRFQASAVVLAAGGWSSRIELEGARSTVPVRPIRGQLLRLSWDGAPLKRVIWSERCYVVPWDDGTLLVGATVEDAGFDERTTVAGVRDLMEAACEVIPRAWNAGFLGARAGLRPATPDELPIIGPSRLIPGLTYATGHYRNGILLAPLTARLVADGLVENRWDPLLASCSPQRFGDL